MNTNIHITSVSSESFTEEKFYDNGDCDLPEYEEDSLCREYDFNEVLMDFTARIKEYPSLYTKGKDLEDVELHVYQHISDRLDRRNPNRAVVLIDAHPGLNLLQAIVFKDYIGDIITETLNDIVMAGYEGEIAYDHDTCSFALNFPDISEAKKFAFRYTE